MASQSNRVGRDDAGPLAGKRIVITRARTQAGILGRKLEALGARVIEFPTIEIHAPEDMRRLDEAIRHFDHYDWVIFTSANGVERFFARAVDLGITIGATTKRRFAAIGPETAKRLQQTDVECTIVPRVLYQAEGLLEALETQQWNDKRVLIPRAAKARDVLPETLRAWGAAVDVVEAYRTRLPEKTGSVKFSGPDRPDAITFTSSSTVANFAQLFENENLASILSGVAVACIGEITRQTVEDLGGHAAIVAPEATIDALVEAIAGYFAAGGAPRQEIS